MSLDRLTALLHLAAGDDVTLPDVDMLWNDPVPGEGPMDARIVAVGESLGHEEADARRNFIGKSGKKLREWMRFAGILPDRCRIENVYPFYPPGGSIDNVEKGTIAHWQADVRDRVRRCTRAEVVLCIGNIALEAFTGYQEITKRRGSVYQWEGRKVVGMIHPAAVLRRPMWEKHCRKDLERVKLLTTAHTTHHAHCGCATRMARHHATPFTGQALLAQRTTEIVRAANNSETCLALDIETPVVHGKREIVCISFAVTPNESIVLPFREYYDTVKTLCELPCIKVGHNIVSFDRWWLDKEGIQLHGEIRDTLTISHALDPASAHSLDYLASTLTYENYYKDEGKGHDIALIDADREGYFAYCGLDSCVTAEVYQRLWPLLERRNLVGFWREHYQDLFDPVLDLMREGVDVDHTYRGQLLTDLLSIARRARDDLGYRAGRPLFTLGTKRDQKVYDALASQRDADLAELIAKYGAQAIQASLDRIAEKTVSNVRLKDVLYNQLGIPVYTRRRKGGVETATADALTLRKIRHEYRDNAEVCAIVDLAMRHNKAQKIASFCYPTHFSDDGKFRFTLKFNTEASRFASSKPPDGIGSNSQNNPRDHTTSIDGITKSVRRMFLPKPGHVIVEADGAQVEGKLCFVYTGDPEMVRLARLRSSEFDQHRYVASLLFFVPESDVTKNQRQVSKPVGHGAQRNLQGLRLSEILLNDGFFNSTTDNPYTEEECEALIEAYHCAFPPIREWQRRIRQEVRNKHCLVSNWGHTWDVSYFEVNEDLFRKAYSWKMQRDCAGMTNQQGFRPLWYWLQGQYAAYMQRQSTFPVGEFLRQWNHTDRMQSRILFQEHDSLVCSAAPSEAYDVAAFLKAHMEYPHTYDGVELGIPIEYKVGANWSECEELRELPSRQIFDEIVRKVLR